MAAAVKRPSSWPPTSLNEDIITKNFEAATSLVVDDNMWLVSCSTGMLLLLLLSFLLLLLLPLLLLLLTAMMLSLSKLLSVTSIFDEFLAAP